MTSAPVLFVSHGAPSVALEDNAYTRALQSYGARLSGITAVVVVSAHWEEYGPVRVTTSPNPATIHDFGGFHDALYAMRYPAPGAPELAAEVIRLLSASGIEARADAERGFDHGVWVPLRLLLPDASTPTIGVSLPAPRESASLVDLGRALSPLRDRGVLIVGSGGVVHNLRRIDSSATDGSVANWAAAFDAWAAGKIAAKDAAGLADYRRSAPSASLAVPTSEHYDPLLTAVGATRPSDRVETLFEGFAYGTLSMRSVAFAA